VTSPPLSARPPTMPDLVPGIAVLLPAARAIREELDRDGRALTRDALAVRLRRRATISATPGSRSCSGHSAMTWPANSRPAHGNHPPRDGNPPGIHPCVPARPLPDGCAMSVRSSAHGLPTLALA
jgi:hypothetical protein